MIPSAWTPPLLVAALLSQRAVSDDPWLVYEGGEGPGAGKHVVLVAGDEEYRSEEALPMLARILAEHHGFRCTVLFSTDPEDGTIDPTNQTHVPGLERLRDADMLVLFFRFRELPDEDMKHLVEYVESGGPVLGIRTATHAFDYRRNEQSRYASYHWRSSEWPGGFGRQILGETWVNHHGGHGRQSTRGVVAEAERAHPILRGVDDVWGPTDVYGIRDLPEDARVLLWGQVLSGMDPSDPPVEGKLNEPMMPLVWIREYQSASGAPARSICSTIGAATDCASEGLRRALVNACYWGMGLEERIPAESRVDIVGEYAPSAFGFGRFRGGVRPSDLRLDRNARIPPPRPAFELVVERPGKEVGNAVLAAPDGGALAVGYADGGGEQGVDVFLVRTDATGETLWTRTWGGPGDQHGWDAVAAPDGGFVVAGFAGEPGSGAGEDVLLLAIDADGEPRWSHGYGGPGDQRCWGLSQTEDGGYLLAAQTDAGGGGWDAYLVRTDASGSVRWARTVGGPGDERVFDVEATPDGGAVLAGTRSSEPGGERDAYLLRVGAGGEVLWERSYGVPGDDVGHGVVTTADGGFLLTGYGPPPQGGSNDVRLIRTDAGGRVLWERRAGGPSDDRAMMSARTRDGGFLAVGYTLATGGWDAYAVRVDAEGSVAWTRTFGGAGNDRGVMGLETPDGGFVITGAYGVAGTESSDLCLVRILP